MSVIKVDFFKGKVPIKVGANPVDVKVSALGMLDGYKTENIMSEPITNQSSVELSPSAQLAENAREMNAAAQSTYGSVNLAIPTPIQHQDNMTVSAMEETPVNATPNNIISNDKLEILRLQKALATANAKIRTGMDSFDEAQQLIMEALQDKQQYEEETSFSKAA